MKKLTTRLWHVLSFGLPFNHDIEVLRKVVLFSSMIILGSIFLLFLGTLSIFQKSLSLTIVEYSLVVFLIILYFYTKTTLNYKFTMTLGTVVFGLFLVYLNITGGVKGTAHLWGFIYPLVALFFNGFQIRKYSFFNLYWYNRAGFLGIHTI